MSSLIDRHHHRLPGPGQADYPPPPRHWKDFIAALIFAAIGLLFTALAILNGIPIGEHVLSGG
jgi:hypothetical protein